MHIGLDFIMVQQSFVNEFTKATAVLKTNLSGSLTKCAMSNYLVIPFYQCPHAPATEFPHHRSLAKGDTILHCHL